MDVVSELNRVIAMHTRSLPTYLADAHPWMQSQQTGECDLLRRIAQNQEETAKAIGDYIIEHDRAVETGQFPMEFTGYHDLSFEYLVPLMLEELTGDIARMERISAAVSSDAEAQALVDRAIGAAKAHSDMLQNCLAA